MLIRFSGLRKVIVPSLRCNSIRGQCTEVKSEQDNVNGVREIILNEPKTRNSLSLAMMEDILAELKQDTGCEQLRSIVLSAKGSVWSAGHNLKELASNSREQQKVIFDKLTEIILHIRQTPIPIIAKVNGLAAAAGCQLVVSCDMVVCSDKSTFSTPGANFGVFCSTPGIAIGRVMPRSKSSYMLLTGLPITAQDAHIAGLVSVVVPEAQLDSEVERITNAISGKSRAVIALGKEFYYKQLSMSINDAYSAGAEKMTENLSLPDGREGLISFAQKRSPKWSHK